jgi:hypothetical protein
MNYASINEAWQEDSSFPTTYAAYGNNLDKMHNFTMKRPELNKPDPELEKHYEIDSSIHYKKNPKHYKKNYNNDSDYEPSLVTKIADKTKMLFKKYLGKKDPYTDDNGWEYPILNDGIDCNSIKNHIRLCPRCVGRRFSPIKNDLFDFISNKDLIIILILIIVIMILNNLSK